MRVAANESARVVSCSAPVVEREQLARDIVSFWLRAEPIAAAVQPGQFVQVGIPYAVPDVAAERRSPPQSVSRTRSGTSVYRSNLQSAICNPQSSTVMPDVPFLRRPFSVAQKRQGRIRIVLRVVGQGTRLLSESRKGDRWNLLGPLGKAIPACPGRVVVLVGGGIGIAPLLFLAEQIARTNRVSVLLGAGNRSELILRSEFSRLPVHLELATEDGSLGRKGMVTDLLARSLKSQSRSAARQIVFACGPRPMLRRVKELGARLETYGFWEERIGCGTGICYGCAVRSTRKEAYIRFCQEGPVLNLADVTFEEPADSCRA